MENIDVAQSQASIQELEEKLKNDELIVSNKVQCPSGCFVQWLALLGSACSSAVEDKHKCTCCIVVGWWGSASKLRHSIHQV